MKRKGPFIHGESLSKEQKFENLGNKKEGIERQITLLRADINELTSLLSDGEKPEIQNELNVKNILLSKLETSLVEAQKAVEDYFADNMIYLVSVDEINPNAARKRELDKERKAEKVVMARKDSHGLALK